MLQYYVKVHCCIVISHIFARYLCKQKVVEWLKVSRSAWFKHRWFRAQCDPFKKKVVTIIKFWGVIEHPCTINSLWGV